MDDHFATGCGASSLDEADVSGRDLGLQGQVELTEPPLLPPPAQQLTDWTLAGEGAGHTLRPYVRWARPGHYLRDKVPLTRDGVHEAERVSAIWIDADLAST